jgi:hypothetical protein
MPTAEERLAALEAKVDAIADLRAIVLDMRAEMNQRFAQVDRRLAQFEYRFAQIDATVDRNFVWVLGMLLTGIIAIIAAMMQLLR